MAKYDLSKILNTQLSSDKVLTVFDIVDKGSDIKEFVKNGAISESFLEKYFCTTNLEHLPEYWLKIINKYPKEKDLFALFALIFMNLTVLNKFSSVFSEGHNGGKFHEDKNRYNEVIRKALIASGAAEAFNAKSKTFSYDFSVALYNAEVGVLFKQLLIDRLKTSFPEIEHDDDILFELFNENQFANVFGITHNFFCDWLNGKATNGSYIKEVDIDNLFCIKENIHLDFEKSKEIYLLGENGDGKTLLLMGIYLAFNSNRVVTFDNDKAGKAQQIIKTSPKLSGYDDTGRPYGEKYSSYLGNFYAYGTHRGVPGKKSEAEKYGFMSLFSIDQTMINPLEWLKNLIFRQIVESGSTADASIFISTTKGANPKKNETNNDGLSFIQRVFDEILDRQVKIVPDKESEEGFKFEENKARLSLDELSEGYRSVIIFICDLLCRLYGNNFSNNFSTDDTKGVVLVDEIDSHLHPRWQRKIVGRIRKLFPNIQFVFSTHSPSIIQGASDEAIIYRVYRKDGITKVSDPFYKRNLNHMMLNTLMTSSLFGLEDARVDENCDYADTSDNYLSSRIEKRLRERIKEEKLGGFLTDAFIDKMIEDAMKKEGVK